MNPDISLILDGGLAWFNDIEHQRQGGHAVVCATFGYYLWVANSKAKQIYNRYSPCQLPAR